MPTLTLSHVTLWIQQRDKKKKKEKKREREKKRKKKDGVGTEGVTTLLVRTSLEEDRGVSEKFGPITLTKEMECLLCI